MQDRLISERIRSGKANVLLLGPRQVGKSTLVKSLEPDVYINLADEAEFMGFARDPSRLRRELSALSKSAALVVVGEVQRIPALLNTVQALIDEDKSRFRFILTGSSARKLKRGGANLLPGRVIREEMCPLLVSELGAAMDLERAITRGTLPGIYFDGENGDEILAAYANTYLREEIQKEGLVENLGAFSRLLDAMALMSGQWLNYSKLSSDTEIPKETVRRYVSILEDTLVFHRLASFQPRHRVSRRVSQKERILFFDVGVRNALLGLHSRKPTSDQRGFMFEQWIMQQVLGLNSTLKKGWAISSFLTSSHLEVDLVVEAAETIIGIEVKSGETLHSRRHQGLAALEECIGDYKPLQKWIVFTGERPQKLEDGTLVLPWKDALQRLEDIDRPGSVD